MARTHDLIVIGAGSAGLTAAGGAARFGLKVALIEQGKMGGECLNTGCVPSKALIAAAKRAHAGRQGMRLGVSLAEPEISFDEVRHHVRSAIDAIAPHDSQTRFEGLGVEVLRGTARFISADTLEVDGRNLSAPRIVIATGSRPAVPEIDGLSEVSFLTNETLFDLAELPMHLVILGGGPIGMEMAQVFRRLGSAVTVVEKGVALAKADRDAAAIVLAELGAEGVSIREDCPTRSIEARSGSAIVSLEDGTRIEASHLLVATGRRANIDALELDRIGVKHGEKGIEVDRSRRTNLKHIFAIGDCRAGPRFTHVAGEEGSIAVLNIALGWPAKVDWARALPSVTYTDPELAQIGPTEAEARQKFAAVDVERQDFTDNDRAVTEGDTRGFLKLIRHRGKLVGVTIVGRGAGDLLLPWAQAMAGKASTFALGSAVVPYPTRSELSKAAAFAAYEPIVFGTWPRRWARLLARTRR